jgi:hypothetical protein
MRIPVFISLVAAAVTVTSCGGITALAPTAPSTTLALPAATAPGTPSAATQSRPISGAVLPLSQYPEPCWADRYACEVFDFSTSREGPIEVTLMWDGAPRALRVQLYWVGGTLAHEDIAPAAGPSRISFLRPRMEAAAYRLRVVSLEPENAIPFTLTVTY